MPRSLMFLALLALVSCRQEASTPPIVRVSANDFPPLTGRVVDAADLLPAGDENALASKLEALEAHTSDQFVVVTLPSLHGHSIEQVGLALGNGWGIGQKDKNNGVLLLVAPNERKVRIEVGYGLESVLSDPLCARIIREDILPRFRTGELRGGILAGANDVIALLDAKSITRKAS